MAAMIVLGFRPGHRVRYRLGETLVNREADLLSILVAT